MDRGEMSSGAVEPPDVDVISITVTKLPQTLGRPLRKRLVAIRVLTAIAIAIAGAGLGAIIASTLQRNRTNAAASTGRARVPVGERTAIAAALGYPYPPRCLTITISDSSPDYARVNVNRTSGCGRYRGYVNSSLHRVDGGWRLVLDEGQLFVPNILLAPNRSGVRRR